MGSMTSFKPSLKLKFGDEHRPFGIRRITLNNADDDLTVSRECLSYDLFREAGIAAPRCGLARVTVNGEVLGIYTHIEEIKKPMLKLNFGEDADKTDLHEITMADFVDDRIIMFEPKGQDDDDDGQPAEMSALQAIERELMNNSVHISRRRIAAILDSLGLERTRKPRKNRQRLPGFRAVF
jgi:hypothetical protein